MMSALFYRFPLVLSSLLILGSLVSVAVFGLRLGFDFTGGALSEFDFGGQPDVARVEEVVDSLGVVTELRVQQAGEDDVLLRTNSLSQEEFSQVESALRDEFGDGVQVLRFESVGPSFGESLRRDTLAAMGLALVAIVLYVAYAFRKIRKPLSVWRFGGAALVALFHDLIVIVGVFALFGGLLGVELDTLFVTAILTVFGYSINDTIVVFDRIRENVFRKPQLQFEDVVKLSVRETMNRSLNTSLTTSLVLLALVLFAPESLRYFVGALLVGVVAGTYSSIFVASPVLAWWQKRRG